MDYEHDDIINDHKDLFWAYTINYNLHESKKSLRGYRGLRSELGIRVGLGLEQVIRVRVRNSSKLGFEFSVRTKCYYDCNS